MRVYFDTGPLIHYLKFRTPYVDAFRSVARHGRVQRQISRDLEECLTGLARAGNSCVTSTLTLVELEGALHEKMKKKSRGVLSGNKIPFFLLSSRALLESAILACQIQGMEIIELRPDHVTLVLCDSEMRARRLAFPDSLHIACAIRSNAEVIFTSLLQSERNNSPKCRYRLLSMRLQKSVRLSEKWRLL